MTKEQTTFRRKDNYFRTPADDLTEPVAEVEAASVEIDGVRYKDKYFQIQCETVGS